MDEVVTLKDTDQAEWRPLFSAYLSPYDLVTAPGSLDATWAELMIGSRIRSFGMRREGALIAFAHFIRHPSTTSADYVYLSDLYTAPHARGGGVARALIQAVADWSKRQGCCRLYWTTRPNNAAARGLYDQLATVTDRLTYHMQL